MSSRSIPSNSAAGSPRRNDPSAPPRSAEQGSGQAVISDVPPLATSRPAVLGDMFPVRGLSPAEKEQRTEKRRLMAATMTTGLVLCLALWVLLWLLFGQGGRGAGTGESSRKGRGAVGEGTGEGPQKASAPTREDGQDESVGDVAGQGLGDPISDASNTESPPPQTHVGEKPPEDAAPIAGTQKGKSRFSIGGSDFFGITADGNAFVYIIDCSGSMAGEKLSKAKAELLRSISGLEADKSFFVIFFSNTHYTMFYPESGHTQLILATTDNKERIRKWVESFSFSGGTMPDSAIQLALTMHPDSIFLLTDGAFADTAVRVARQFNPSKIPINTIGFQDLGGAVNLKQISSDSGGKYKYVP